jgi:hypothetical protein
MIPKHKIDPDDQVRRDRLKAMIEALDSMQLAELEEKMVNKSKETEPSYQNFGDTDPRDINMEKLISYSSGGPATIYDRDNYPPERPWLWAEKVVETFRAKDEDIPEKIRVGNKIYDIVIIPAVLGNPARGIAPQDEQITAVESKF